MRSALALLIVYILSGGSAAHAGTLHCARKSLAEAVSRLKAPNRTIVFTGVCTGPIVVRVDGLSLVGKDTAVIDGGGGDAVTIEGASRVSLVDVEIRNGLNGIVATGGARIALTRVSSHDNTMSGIVLRSSSSATGSAVTATQNGGAGLSADDGAAISLADATLTANAATDILLTFGSRADLRTIVFGTYGCDATVLVRGTAGLTCPH
jgi:hypothetical protein